MTEPSERDRQRLANIREAWAHEDEHYHALPFMLRLYDAAREEGRRAAIEECTRLREALEPFAQRAEYFDARLKANGSAWRDEDGYVDDPPSDIYLKHLRDARRALAKP